MPDLQIIRAYRNLAALAHTVIPARIGSSEPNYDDAKAIQDDLLTLANRVDAVVEAYGKYLQAYGLISGAELRTCFTNQLLEALDGNALYCVESGITQRIEERMSA